MKVILECKGDREMWQNIFTAKDEEFEICDSIFYEMDYDPDKRGIHRTEYGDMIISIIEEE